MVGRRRFRELVVPRILAVDDELVIRQFTHDALTDDGFEVKTAATTSEALALAKKEAFDLFVCDVNVPEINGFGLRDEVKKIGRFAQTPFLFVSGADPQMRAFRF